MRAKFRGGDGVGRGAAEAFASILALDAAFGQGHAAGSHGAVFTADTLKTDGAGFHLLRPVEHRIDAQLLSAFDHFLGSRIDGCSNGIGQFGSFFCCHFGFFSSAIRGSSSYCL
jgi:hypothetical protein